MSMVNIVGLNKEALLEKLWLRSKIAGFYNAGPGPSYNKAEAKMKLDSGFVDYVCGRVIKCNLHQDTVDPRLYDRDNGSGSFADVVAQMRQNE